MHLYIDTSDPDKIKIKLGEKEFIAQSRKNKTQYLLEFIDEKISESGRQIGDVSKITINKGPGSFTGLRVGATVASSLAWDLNIPVDIDLRLV